MSGNGTTPECFHFRPGEREVVDGVIRAVRALLARRDLPPKQVHCSAVLLHALERLPLTTPGAGITLCLIQPNESGKSWTGVTVDDERFELDRGATIYAEGIGSDNESQSDFLVYTHGRADTYLLGDLTGWVETFHWLCEQPEVEVDFDVFGDPAPDWDAEGDPEWWNRLPEPEQLEG